MVLLEFTCKCGHASRLHVLGVGRCNGLLTRGFLFKSYRVEHFCSCFVFDRRVRKM